MSQFVAALQQASGSCRGAALLLGCAALLSGCTASGQASAGNGGKSPAAKAVTVPRPESPSPGARSMNADVVFATLNERKLLVDVYPPSGAARGLVVYVHGGAWRAGSRKSVELQGLTEHGWAVASVDYRLSPEARFPAQVHDIKAAVRFLRARASELGFPGDRIAIAGSSAGGHLAALVGVSNGHPELEGQVGSDLGTSSAVQAAVVLYGASNLETILSQSTPHGLSVRVPALQLLLGAEPEQVPELARLASPVSHVDAADPPLLLLHGDQDNQMPINQAHELHAAYRAEGASVQFHVVHGAGHGGPQFSSPEQLSRIAAFLDQHLLPPLR